MILLAILISVILVVNSTKRLLTFRTTAQKVEETAGRLEELKRQNESLKRELEYKSTEGFAEKEIRDKLGLTKKGEAVVIVPKEDDKPSFDKTSEGKLEPNWQKWWNLFFGG